MGPSRQEPVEEPVDDTDSLQDGADVDAEELARYSGLLASAVEAALGPWVVRCVLARTTTADVALRAEAEVVGVAVVAEIGPRVRSLLELDVDDQRINPLALIREAVIWPTSVLRTHGVVPVRRDAEAQRLFPDDDYDLTPASWADIAPELQEPGLRWGAAKAHVVMRRQRSARRT